MTVCVEGEAGWGGWPGGRGGGGGGEFCTCMGYSVPRARIAEHAWSVMYSLKRALEFDREAIKPNTLRTAVRAGTVREGRHAGGVGTKPD